MTIWTEDDGPVEEPDDDEGFTCGTCGDTGAITYYHPSFDYPVGGDPCPDLDDPVKHPPSTPVPLQIAAVSRHMPGCDGDCNFGYPDGCPPF